MTSISNMPKIKTEDRGEWEADIYATSMKMSTYLVAFIVGEYTGVTQFNVTIWTPSAQSGSADFVLRTTHKLIKFYEEMLDIPYAAPKLDMAAVTKLNGVGMENWGLIIYQEDELSEEMGSYRNGAVAAMAHEIAHQWFGNLVTLKWWSDIWLNEGITTYMQHIAFKHLFPEFNKIEKTLVMGSNNIFLVECCRKGIEAIASEHIFSIDCADYWDSRTVWKNVTDKNSANTPYLFDVMTYRKGAIIIQMVHHILGNETFWKFLSTYLKENAYGSIEESDFWKYVDKAQYEKPKNAKTNMEKMSSWTHHPGIPIVSVRRNYSEGTATFSQQSCRKDTDHISDLWQIPMAYRNQNDKDENPPMITWLSERDSEKIQMPAKDEWVLFNQQSAVNIIVNYDKDNWKLLANQLRKNHEVFTREQRYKILADANNLFMLKFPGVTADILLDLCSYLHNEKELSIFGEPNYNFIMSTIHLMKGSPIAEWKEYILHILGPLYNDLVLKGDEASSTLDLDVLGGQLCKFGHPTCVQKAMKEFADWKDALTRKTHKISIETENRNLICTAIRENESNLKFMEELYEKDPNSSYLKYLFCNRNSTYVRRLLQKLHTGNSKFFDYAKVIADLEDEHSSMLFDYFDKSFRRYIKNKDTVTELWNFSYFHNKSPVYAQKIISIIKKHLRTMSWKMKLDLKRVVEASEKSLTNTKVHFDVIVQWLKQRPWL